MRLTGLGWTEIGERLGLGLTRDGVRQLWLWHAPSEDLEAAAVAVAALRHATRERIRQQRQEAAARRAARRSEAQERVLDAMRDWQALFGEPPGASDWNPTQARTLADAGGTTSDCR